LARDAALLRKFIIEECAFTGPGDPIHSQHIYLTPELLRRLFEKYGIRPYGVHQYPGEAVFIPAYCAHQVANMVDEIKVACDFFSMTNLRRTERIVGELRHQRLSESEGDDVLQFYLTLWYAWLSLSQLANAYSSDIASQDSFRELDTLADTSVYPNSASIPIDALSQMPEYITTHMADSDALEDPATSVMGATRNEKRWQKAKDRKKFRKDILAVRAKGPDHIWHCPFQTCCRRLNRSGVFDHL
jgi:hypothetical protein